MTKFMKALVIFAMLMTSASVFAEPTGGTHERIRFLRSIEFQRLSVEQQREYVKAVVDLLRDLNGRNLNVSQANRHYLEEFWAMFWPTAHATSASGQCVIVDFHAASDGPSVKVQCANSQDDSGSYEGYLEAIFAQYDRPGQNVYQFLAANKNKVLPGVYSYQAFQYVNAMSDADQAKVFDWLQHHNPDQVTTSDPAIKAFLDRYDAHIKPVVPTPTPASTAAPAKAPAFPDLSGAVSQDVDPKTDLKAIRGTTSKPCPDGFSFYFYPGQNGDITGCVKSDKAQGWNHALNGNGFGAGQDTKAITALNTAIQAGQTSAAPTALEPIPTTDAVPAAPVAPAVTLTPNLTPAETVTGTDVITDSPQLVKPEAMRKAVMENALCIYAGYVIRKTDPKPPTSSASSHHRRGNPLCLPVSDWHGEHCPANKKDRRAKVLCNPLLFGVQPDDKPFCIELTSKATESCWLVAHRAYKGKIDQMFDKAIAFMKANPRDADSLNEALSNLCNKKSAIYAMDTNPRAVRKFQGDIAKTCAVFADRMRLIYKHAPDLAPSADADPASSTK